MFRKDPVINITENGKLYKSNFLAFFQVVTELQNGNGITVTELHRHKICTFPTDYVHDILNRRFAYGLEQ